MQRLAGHWKISVQLLIDRYTRLAPNRAQLCLMADEDGACCFLQENKCICYDARPDQCRQYPSLWAPPEGCPGFSADPARIEQVRIQWN